MSKKNSKFQNGGGSSTASADKNSQNDSEIPHVLYLTGLNGSCFWLSIAKTTLLEGGKKRQMPGVKLKEGDDPKKVAVKYCNEKMGLVIDPSKLKPLFEGKIFVDKERPGCKQKVTAYAFDTTNKFIEDTSYQLINIKTIQDQAKTSKINNVMPITLSMLEAIDPKRIFPIHNN